MNFKPLGPDGVQQRMRQIQARIDTVFPRIERNRPSEPRPWEMPGTMFGEIGRGSSDGNRPLNPFGPGVTTEGLVVPPNLAPLIHDAAQSASIDPALFESLVACESAFDPRATSRAGAMGLSQLMPGTAKALGVQNPYDPRENLMGGARYLAQMLSRFGGDLRLALAAYNAGPGAVERHGGIPPFRETHTYVQRVLARYEAVKRL